MCVPKLPQLVGLTFLLFVIGSCYAGAQDVKGTWTGWVETDDLLGAMSLDIRESGSTMTLYYAGDKRSGPIDGLTMNGSEITFMGKLQPSANFKGIVENGHISGTVEIVNRTTPNTGKWSVRRGDVVIGAARQSAPAMQAGLPSPSGSFAIGRRFYFWQDDRRDEAITPDPSDKRRVFTQVWYPGAKRQGTTADYVPATVTTETANVPTGVRIHAVQDRTPAKGKFPLIVFSPGLGSDPLKYASIIEDLVSNGYVVAAINHPYDSAPVLWPDGTKIETSKKWDQEVPKDWSADERRKFFDERRFEWAKDASFVVDQLGRSDLAKLVDFNDIGMLGHSFGGQAASIVCASDARVKACANLDGLAQGLAVLPTSDGKGMTQPFLFFTKVAYVTDAELKMMGMTRDEYLSRERKRLLERWNPGFKKQIAAIASGGYLIIYPGASHGSFSDGPLIDASSTEPPAIRLERTRNIDRYVLAFFDQTLKGKTSELLKSQSPSDSSVIVEFLKK